MTRAGVALGLAVCGAVVVWLSLHLRTAWVSRVLDLAARREDWLAVLAECQESERIVREEPALQELCGRAARAAAEGPASGEDPSVATMRIRRLAEWGDRTLLAAALDRSVVVVPTGDFVMGSNAGRDDERPEHRVHLEAYAMGRFEVTNVQYVRFLEATGRNAPRYWQGQSYPRAQEDMPVMGVTWEAAEAYCEWSGGRLPTEAQWEAACRGPGGRIFPWGSSWEDGRANIAVSTEPAVGSYLDALWPILRSTPASPTVPGPRPVGSFLGGASPLGLLDMQGNAAEWARDWYTWEGYWNMPASNPIGEGPRWNRSIRGSPWFFGMGMEEEAVFWSRCSARNSSHSSDDPRVGFRCVYPAE